MELPTGTITPNGIYTTPFSTKFIPAYAHAFSALLSAILGLSKKCLVLDLDNTLWGGTIGDDGLNGIRLGQGDPIGEAFLDIQRMILSLRANGIIIAVCSKNEMENALIPFRSHPDMLIKEEDISVFVANWDDKASNIENIASKLNIGIESIVFLDDNPFERELVRNALPQVAVPELSNDPSTFVRDFLEARYFETIAITEEDKMRPINYKQNADRSESIKNSRNIKEYLKTLEMELSRDSLSFQ